MKQEVQLLYLEFTDLWKSLCDVHNQLYQFTCEEYLALLNSNIDRVHTLLENKELVMKSIDELEGERLALVHRVADHAQLSLTHFAKFKEVYAFFKEQINLTDYNPLLKYHTLMIDLIEKTQEQNKKNRIFLNKALHSIQELRNDLNGNTKVNNYSRTGEKQAHCR